MVIEVARLAVHVVDSGTECGEFLATAAIATVIQSLLVYQPLVKYSIQVPGTSTAEFVLTNWRIQVLVEASYLTELSRTEVTFISRASPFSPGRFVLRVVTPADVFLRDGAFWISGSHDLVERYTVHVTRLWASTHLQVVHEAGGGGVGCHA